jgi:hypothetical protein
MTFKVGSNVDCIVVILKLVVCILFRVLGQVQGFRLTQHWFEYLFSNNNLPIAVAERSRARTVFARSNTAIVGSNPT